MRKSKLCSVPRHLQFINVSQLCTSGSRICIRRSLLNISDMTSRNLALPLSWWLSEIMSTCLSRHSCHPSLLKWQHCFPGVAAVLSAAMRSMQMLQQFISPLPQGLPASWSNLHAKLWWCKCSKECSIWFVTGGGISSVDCSGSAGRMLCSSVCWPAADAYY